MSEPFRSRRFVPVDPGARPRRERRAVRVVVTDGFRVLLFPDSDPGLPGSRWWVTPGGGIDPGETERAAAVRELAEETGLVLTEDDLTGPVLRRTVVHGYSDQVLTQREAFFVLTVPESFEVDVTGHTPDEQLTLGAAAWHRLDVLSDLPEPVWPAYLADLPALADDPAAWPREVGLEEESTVAVGDPATTMMGFAADPEVP